MKIDRYLEHTPIHSYVKFESNLTKTLASALYTRKTFKKFEIIKIFQVKI